MSGGFISNMQTSLKTNNRRKRRERLKAPESVTSKKTRYNVKEVSETERKKLVKRITRRRKSIDRIAYIAIILAAIFLLYFLLM